MTKIDTQNFSTCSKLVREDANFMLFVLCFVLFFLVGAVREAKYHHKRAIIGPPAKRHLNGVSLASR